MATNISVEEFVQGFLDANKNAELTLETSEKILANIKEMGEILQKRKESIIPGNAKDMAELNQLLEDSNKLVADREKEDIKHKKTKKQLKDLTDAELKNREIEKKQLKDRITTIKLEVAVEQSLVKSREGLLAANKKLEDQRKRLSTETQADEIANLNAQIDANNEILNENSSKLEQQRNKIGGYTEGITAALKGTRLFGDELDKFGPILTGLNKLWDKNEDKVEDAGDAADKTGRRFKNLGKNLKASGIAILVGALTALGAAFATSRTGSKELKESTAELKAVFTVLTQALAQTGLGLFRFFGSIDNIFSSMITKFDLFSAKVDKGALEMLPSFLVAKGAVKALDEEIERLTKKQEENNREIAEGKAGLDIISEAWKDFGKRVEETTEQIEKQIDREDKLIDTRRILAIQIAELRKQEELARSKEGENAASFQDRIVATEALVVLGKERTELTVKLAKAELLLVDAEVKAARAASGKGDNFKFSIELSEKLTAATVALKEAETDRVTSEVENRTLLTQLALDIFERDLDILLDGFDRQKIINEKRLANDRITLEEKKKILAELTEAQKEFIANSNEAFNASLIDLDFTKEEIDLIKQKVDIEKLILTLEKEGSKVLQEEIRALETGEILEGRILEFVKDIAEFKNDNLETTQAIADETREIAILEAEIAHQRRLLADGDEKESADKLRADKVAILEADLAREKEGSLKFLQIEKDLNALKLEDHKTLNDKKLEDDKRAAKEREELFKQLQKVIDKRTSEFFDKNLSNIDQEKQAHLQALEVINEAEKEGSEEAKQSAALERRRLAQLEADKREQEAQRLKAEAIIALLQVFAKTGDARTTLTGFAEILAASNALTGFKEGTDNTGTTGAIRDKDGVITGYTHANEMVFSEDQTNAMGNKSRREVMDIVAMSDRGMAVNHKGVLVQNDNSDVVSEIIALRKVMEKMPSQMPKHTTPDIPKAMDEHTDWKNQKQAAIDKSRKGWGL